LARADALGGRGHAQRQRGPAFVTRAIRANVAGTVKVDLYTGGSVTMNFAAGETRSVRATRVYAAGTTATGIEVMA
jgi:hypothetical protein